jgi:ligand-binding sensor domain-containing protein
MNGIAAFNQKGLHLWTHFFQRQTDGKVFPLLYNECLTVCFDSKCMAIDSQDKAILEFDLMEGQIRTALIPDASGNYFVGTNKGAYKIY